MGEDEPRRRHLGISGLQPPEETYQERGVTSFLNSYPGIPKDGMVRLLVVVGYQLGDGDEGLEELLGSATTVDPLGETDREIQIRQKIQTEAIPKRGLERIFQLLAKKLQLNEEIVEILIS